MSDEELRAWLTKMLVEFGAGPTPMSRFHACEWYQRGGITVEDFSNRRDEREREHLFFEFDDTGGGGSTVSFTKAGLDFIKGEQDGM